MGTRYPGSGAVSAATSLVIRRKSTAEGTITGAINDVNTIFTIADSAVVGSAIAFQNGVELRYGVDFTVSGVTWTFAIAPVTGDRLDFYYSALV